METAMQGFPHLCDFRYLIALLLPAGDVEPQNALLRGLQVPALLLRGLPALGLASSQAAMPGHSAVKL